jgi:hypothetical protein
MLISGLNTIKSLPILIVLKADEISWGGLTPIVRNIQHRIPSHGCYRNFHCDLRGWIFLGMRLSYFPFQPYTDGDTIGRQRSRPGSLHSGCENHSFMLRQGLYGHSVEWIRVVCERGRACLMRLHHRILFAVCCMRRLPGAYLVQLGRLDVPLLAHSYWLWIIYSPIRHQDPFMGYVRHSGMC